MSQQIKPGSVITGTAYDPKAYTHTISNDKLNMNAVQTGSINHKIDIDLLKKEIERHSQGEVQVRRSPDEIFVKSYSDFENATRPLKDHIEGLQNQIDQIEKSKEEYESLTFKSGDVAFHKQYGNVLIRGVTLNKINFEASRYSIVTQDIMVSVALDELVPISEATKVLFGKR